MSTTLVETFPFPAPHQIQSIPQRLPLATAPSNVSSHEERWAAQLVHLASQHHLSEYNCLKFGHQGAPIAYIPLSIELPAHVQKLQALQFENSKQKAWWPCNQTSDIADAERHIELPQCGVPALSTVDIREEISAAISTSLTNPHDEIPITPNLHQVKTSETHPINISMIIPPELLSVISNRIAYSQRYYPTTFDIPPAYALDRIIGPKSFPTAHRAPSFRPPYSSLPAIWKSSPSEPLRNQSSVSEALQAAINSGLAAAIHANTSNLLPQRLSPPKRKLMIPSFLNEKSIVANTPLHEASASNSHSRAYSAPPTFVVSLIPTPSSSTSTNDPLSHITPYDIVSTRISSRERAPSVPLPSLVSHDNLVSQPISLGNLFLSSCPGKKVRLNGPVKGRSTVCRDLGTDINRMKSLGVRCVVCCLDDTELDFLGASWPEYSRAASEIGVDVLRIPTPEGLSPPTPQQLDYYLTRLIKTYTLNGFPILVHCRGGVGRAGLVACCWMLKLGLCGWIETDPRPSGRTAGVVRRDTMQLVERAISVVRRRRSVKAIETYEQVKFLVDFVEYLREKAMAVPDMEGPYL